MSLAALPLGAAAQEGGLNRQVEVTRDYEPTVSESPKLGIKPVMRDTVPLRPDISYRIFPSPIASGFNVAPIRAAGFSSIAPYKRNSLYVRAGLGYPFQSVGDVIYSLHASPRTDFMAGASHYGSYSKIKNDYGDKAPALYTYNDLYGRVKHRFGRADRYSVEGGVALGYDALSRFGYYNFSDLLPAGFDSSKDALRQNFTTLGADVSVGDDFSDLSRLNFKVGAETHYINDKFDSHETGFGVHVDLARGFKEAHRIDLGLGFHMDKGNGKMGKHDHLMFSFAPQYSYEGDKASVSVGLNLVGDRCNVDDENNFYVMPLVGLKYKLANDYLIAFLDIDGEVGEGSYYEAVKLNPYVMSGLTLESTAAYNIRAGVEGSVSSAFSYRVFGGASFYRNMNVFSNYYDLSGFTSMGNTFTALVDDGMIWVVGGEISGHFARNFEYGLIAKYMGCDMRHLPVGDGLPSFEMEASLRYTLGKKFTAGLSMQAYDGRICYETTFDGTDEMLGTNKIGGNVNLSLNADYRLSKVTTLFLEADNLLNAKQYRFNRVPTLGIGAICGVKLCF